MKALLLLLLAIPSAGFCQTREIVVPNANSSSTAFGNGANSLPFLIATNASARYQQLYAATEFTNFPAQGGLITRVVLRPGLDAPNFDTTVQSIQINLSTTSHSPDSLSPVFVQNLGTDDTVVYALGSLAIQSSGGTGLTPWDVVIPLNTPFLYRPSDGNLLMDVRTFAGAPPPPSLVFSWLDGVLAVGDPVSSVYAYTGTGQGNVNSPSGVLSTFGFVTLFEFTPIPEPNSALLLCVAGVMFIFALGRRKERN